MPSIGIDNWRIAQMKLKINLMGYFANEKPSAPLKNVASNTIISEWMAIYEKLSKYIPANYLFSNF